jgi:glutamine transport system permease protein
MTATLFRRLATAGTLAAALLLLTGCGGGWGWYEVLPTTPRGRENFFFLLSGFWLTLAISGVALFFSVLIGLVVALPGLARDPRLRWCNRIYVEIFRAIPILVMLLWTYYGLPILLGISLSAFVAGVVALALCDSAFEAEIFRAGIQSIERGQIDGADSLGLGYVQKMRFVVLPQAIRRILPALGNQFVYMLKMSSLVYVLGLPELTRRANELVGHRLPPAGDLQHPRPRVPGADPRRLLAGAPPGEAHGCQRPARGRLDARIEPARRPERQLDVAKPGPQARRREALWRLWHFSAPLLPARVSEMPPPYCDVRGKISRPPG